MQTENNTKQSLAEHTAEQIMEIISVQNIQPGGKIPTEAELTTRLGISRGTVREGARLLIARNILESRRGSGTYLSEKRGVADDPLGFSLEPDKIRTAHDFAQLRRALEPYMASLAAKNRNEQDLQTLKELFEKMKLAVERRAGGFRSGEVEKHMELDCAFHEQLAVCSDNSVMIKLMPIINEGLLTIHDIQNSQRRAEQTVDEHWRIYKAVAAGDPMAAGDAMLMHLMMTEKLSHLGSI